jgi:HEAT repeat protein
VAGGALISGVRLLVIVAPLRLTVWVVAVGTAIILVLMAVGVSEHVRRARAARRREHVHDELQPVFARFLETDDEQGLAASLRPVFMRMDAAHRPVAAALVTDVMGQATVSQRQSLRSALEQAGIVELGHRGTRRLSPWRRALACEMLGKIGSPSSVPALLARLRDRRPEVRIAAVRALGEIGSAEAVPALSEAFLERRVAPPQVVNVALRRIGGEAGPAFERGIASADPIIRISSCFGLSGIAAGHGGAAFRLASVLGSDADARVRTAAASGLGIVGGGAAPEALVDATADPDVDVRRAAVKALGSFDDPAAAVTLDDRTEDADREVALRAAEALVALTRRPRAGAAAHARLESSAAWAVDYARQVAEIEGARAVAEVSA